MDIMGLKGLKEKQNWQSTFSNSEFENFDVQFFSLSRFPSLRKKDSTSTIILGGEVE